MHQRLAFFVGFTLLACAASAEEDEPARPGKVEARSLDGVYMTCAERMGGAATIELEAGRFRYDGHVSLGPTEFGPYEGEFSLTDNTLRFHHDEMDPPTVTFDVVDDVRVLWRDDALELWRNRGRIWPYGCFIRAGDASRKDAIRFAAYDPNNPRPTAKVLFDDAKRAELEKEYNERFSDVPLPARRLLRALTEEPLRRSYAAEVRKARVSLNPELVNQLVALLERDDWPRSFYRELLGYGRPYANEAREVLEALCLGTVYAKGRPAFNRSRADLSRALVILADSMQHARNLPALDFTLRLFLRVSMMPVREGDVLEACVRWAGGKLGKELSIEWESLCRELKPELGAEEFAVITAGCRRWCLRKIEEKFGADTGPGE